MLDVTKRISIIQNPNGSLAVGVQLDSTSEDKQFFEVPGTGFDPTIHAIQWDGRAGEIEFKRNVSGKHLPARITTLAPYQSVLAAWEAKKAQWEAAIVLPPLPLMPDELVDVNFVHDKLQRALMLLLAELTQQPIGVLMDKLKQYYRGTLQ